MEKYLSYRSSHLSGLSAKAVGKETDVSSERPRTKAKHLIGFAHSSFPSAINENVWFDSRPSKAGSFSGTSRVLRSAGPTSIFFRLLFVLSWAMRKVLMCNNLPSTVGVCRVRTRRGYGSGGGGEPGAEGVASHGCTSSQNYFDGGVPKSPGNCTRSSSRGHPRGRFPRAPPILRTPGGYFPPGYYHRIDGTTAGSVRAWIVPEHTY